MASVKILLAGDDGPAAALESALRERAIECQPLSSPDLATALTETENRIEAERPEAAVVVGTGDDALALAISAAKAGVPVAAVQLPSGSEPADKSRILTTLATLETGADPSRAADLIASWLHEGTLPVNLD